MSRRLEGRTALITGASRGIGEAIALEMARQGARVVVSSRREDGVAAAAARINAVVPGSALGRVCHVGEIASLDSFVGGLWDELGRVDVLVNNAGTNPYFGPMLGMDWGAWHKTFQVNVEGPFELSRAVARRLIDAGHPGSIIFTSSIFGLRGSPGQGIYAMTKASLVSLTRTLALEWGRAGIRVNAIAPGLVETRLASALLDNPAVLDAYNARTGLGRPGKPAEIAGLAAFLAGGESSYMTGQVLPVDGGFTCG